MVHTSRMLKGMLAAVACVSMAADAQSAGQSRPESAAIRGRVTDASARQPAQGVHVRLQLGAARPQSAFTDGEGRFAFSGLQAGRYSIAFTKGGFVTVRFGQRHQVDDVRTIDLAPGQVVDDIDVALPPAGAIEGTVVDEKGEPLVEARVSAMRTQFAEDGRRLVPVGRTATTDDRGRYRLYGLPSGEYIVAAAVGAAGSIPPSPQKQDGGTGFAPTYHPGAEDLAGAQRVAVRPGADTLAVDIVFRPVRLARVAGVVTSSLGVLDAGAHVSLVRPRSARLPSSGAIVARIAPGGAFALTGVPPGDYVLEARSVPVRTIDSVARSGRVTNETFGGGEFGAMPITVAGMDIADLAISISRGGRLRGRLVLDGQPHVPKPDAPVTVTAIPAGPGAQVAGPPSADVKGNGAFEIAGLAGRFIVRVTGLPSGVAMSGVTTGAQDVADTGVDVRPGENVAGLEVHLTTSLSSLAGRVVSDAGGDLDGCTVVVFSSDRNKWSWPSTRYVGAAGAGRDGAYQVESLPPGSYFVLALGYVESGQWRDPEFLEGASRSARQVHLSAGISQRLDLPCFVQ